MDNEGEARDKDVSDLDPEVVDWPLTEIGNWWADEICPDKDA